MSGRKSLNCTKVLVLAKCFPGEGPANQEIIQIRNRISDQELLSDLVFEAVGGDRCDPYSPYSYRIRINLHSDAYAGAWFTEHAPEEVIREIATG
ncbi:hypothetical protein LCGC14_1497840 [marine sediment metagenome]|uniref:Uncharacterized protein n=1 Tax=marine sediment metagenome TaxID=412755 RepID=A0A0F9LKM6_9ZZZZ